MRRVILPPIVAALGGLLSWELAVIVLKPAAYLLPPPSAIAKARSFTAIRSASFGPSAWT